MIKKEITKSYGGVFFKYRDKNSNNIKYEKERMTVDDVTTIHGQIGVESTRAHSRPR